MRRTVKSYRALALQYFHLKGGSRCRSEGRLAKGSLWGNFVSLNCAQAHSPVSEIPTLDDQPRKSLFQLPRLVLHSAFPLHKLAVIDF